MDGRIDVSLALSRVSQIISDGWWGRWLPTKRTSALCDVNDEEESEIKLSSRVVCGLLFWQSEEAVECIKKKNPIRFN